jgi:hypothetical protein
MRSHVYLLGLAGGVCVSAALYYPLYLYLPSLYIAGWESAQPGLAQILVGVALLLVLVTGAVAARVSGMASRPQAAIAGAVAGLIAAAIAEVWLGAPAAGVWGARGLLTYGFQPMSNEAQFADLLTNGIISTVWWTYASEWMAILGGLALGALGGFLAGPGGVPNAPASDTWPVELSVIGLLTSALGIIVSITTLALLGPKAQEFADKNSVVLAYPSDTVLNWAAATTFAIFLTWQALGAWWLKSAKPATFAGHYRLLLVTYFNGFLPIILSVFLVITNKDALLNPAVLIGILLMLGLAALTLRIGWPLRSQPKPIASTPVEPTRARFYLKEAMLCAAVIFSAVYFGTPAAGLNLIMLVVTGIVFWNNFGPTALPNNPDPTQTVAQAVRDAYAAHQQYILIGSVAIFAIGLLIAGGIYFFMRWRANKSTTSIASTPN